MGSLSFRAEHRQQQTLSPRLQHAVRLLQMSSLEFAQEVHDALGRNPFLDEDPDGETREQSPEGSADDYPATGADALAQPLGMEDPASGGESDRDIWLGDGFRGSGRAEGDELSALDMMACDASLAAHLHAQLSAQAMGQREQLLAKVIIESLDDDGYLRTELQELLAIAELTPAVTLHEMELALCRVQALDPAGVGARSVAECLLLQLPEIECPQMRELASHIVTDHLPLLAAKDVGALARAYARTPAEVERVCQRIRRLDPRPGWHFGSSNIQYVVPDVIVRKVRGAWTTQLNPAVVPKVRLNRVYAEMFRCHRQTGDGELASHLQEARWTLSNVERRFSTILDVADAIVKRQRHFLEFGPMAMKPLGLREIAEDVGVHESTVCRVTNNKYLATPSGVFELKYFFSRAMPSSSGKACSGTAIRGLVEDMLRTEPAHAPLSDAEIARRLARQGLTVARRTVTKYRQLLHVEPVERRRLHARLSA